MSAKDEAARFLGIKIDELRSGYARLSMTVKKDFLNGFHICHGGIIFTLADSAFAYACNSHNEVNVALSCNINYVVAVHAGDKLTATANELTVSRRTGVYDIAVVNQSNVLVATFRGTSYNTKKAVTQDSPQILDTTAQRKE
jgi:acyl-CoA thioesterase